jgi:MarR family transcriptional regulator for hemolysin
MGGWGLMKRSDFLKTVDLIENVVSSATRFFMQRFKTACAELNLSLTHGQVLLFVLRGRKHFSQTEICEYMEADPSKLSRLVDGVEKMGLVRRVVPQENRRANFVELTDTGQAVATNLWEKTNDIYFELLKPLDKTEFEMIKIIFNKIERSLQK